jgi:hypothetical protein
MNVHRLWALVGLVAPLGVVVLFKVRGFRFRRKVNALFAKSECKGDSLTPIAQTLIAVNDRYEDYSFGLERAARIPFRGQQIWFVFGQAGPTDFPADWPFARRWRSLYALAESQEQAHWMANNSDIFSPVRPGSTLPVFWVKLSTLVKDPEIRAQ